MLGESETIPNILFTVFDTSATCYASIVKLLETK